MRLKRRAMGLVSPNDYYQVLGVARDAPFGESRTAFVRLSRRHHPDLAGDLSRRLQDIQRAYHCLSNMKARAKHDRLLQVADRDHRRRQRAVLRHLRRHDRRRGAAASRQRRRDAAFVLLLVLTLLVLLSLRRAA